MSPARLAAVRRYALGSLCAWVSVLSPLSSSGETWPSIGWSLSASAEDPFVHTDTPSVGIDSLYVWLACTVDTSDALPGRDQISSAEFDLSGTFAGLQGTPIGVNGALWFRAEAGRLLVALGGCPRGPLLVGVLPVWDDGTGGWACFEASSLGLNVTVDCSSHFGALRPNVYTGFASDGSEPCRSTSSLCPAPISVEGSHWGEVKSNYRATQE